VFLFSRRRHNSEPAADAYQGMIPLFPPGNPVTLSNIATRENFYEHCSSEIRVTANRKDYRDSWKCMFVVRDPCFPCLWDESALDGRDKSVCLGIRLLSS